jgi:hypothetical protein
MKATVMTTGPGVIMATATASRNWLSFSSRNIIGERALRARFGQDLIGWHVEEFWLGIDKMADEPGPGNAIDFGPCTCNPFHRRLLSLMLPPEALPRKRLPRVHSRSSMCATSPLDKAHQKT